MFKLLGKYVQISNVIKRDCSNLYKYCVISDIQINKQTNDKILVKGWVKALRKQKQNVFIEVSDGSCSERLQILVSASNKPSNLSMGSSIAASGELTKSPKGQLELIANEINVIGECVVTDGYPFVPKQVHPPEYIRQYLHFRPRTNKFASLLRIRDAATRAINDFFHSEGYFQIHTPILTSNDCEGAGEVFTVEPENKGMLKEMTKEGIKTNEAYFDTKAYLTVSGQLHLEAVAHGLSKVYTFGPTFRAENSKSRLHLSEFYMIEAEIAFIDDISEIMRVTEKLVKNATDTILNKYNKDIPALNELPDTNFDWLGKPFITITYDEALKILENNKSKLSSGVEKSEGLTKEHELFLVNHCGGCLVFVINWPKQLKSFYMKQCRNDASKVAAFDLLAPVVGEIVGGSLRENDYDLLKSRLPPGKKELDWYLELRKFGSVPTGGFGMGFERYLQLILGINNIKDTIPFPRWPHNCSL